MDNLTRSFSNLRLSNTLVFYINKQELKRHVSELKCRCLEEEDVLWLLKHQDTTLGDLFFEIKQLNPFSRLRLYNYFYVELLNKRFPSIYLILQIFTSLANEEELRKYAIIERLITEEYNRIQRINNL